MTNREVVRMGELDAVNGGPRGSEPHEPAVASGAAALREKVGRGEAVSPDEWAAAVRIGLRVQLPPGGLVSGHGCAACERRFVAGDYIVFARADGRAAFPGPEIPVGLVHEGCAADASVPWSAVVAADSAAEAHEVFAGADHADPGDETDHDRVRESLRKLENGELDRAGEFEERHDAALERFHKSLERLPEVTSEHNPDAEAALGGGVVRVPLVDRDTPAPADVAILDDDDLTRLENRLAGPGDLTGELEDLVTVDEARALVATALEARDVARGVVDTQAQLFQALMELAAVAGCAELYRQGKMFVRATFSGDVDGQEATLLIGRGPYAGELAAWADTKTAAAAETSE